MFSGRNILLRLSTRSRLVLNRPFCVNNNKPISLENSDGKVSSSEVESSSGLSRHDAYRQLENLDFVTATKILFTKPTTKKKFGLDFHLVQLFVACLPSLAVYLVAQYARYEMRRMEAEVEVKKKAEEEAKAKELELAAEEETQEGTDPQLKEVKARLDKLEETIKEIAIESKQQSGVSTERPVGNDSSKEPGNNEPANHNVKENTTPSEGKAHAKTS